MTSENLREQLVQCGLSQAVFARLINVTPRAVSLWLAGEREIPGPAESYLRLFQVLPENLRRIELARLKDRGTGMRDGMFGVTYQGQHGAGMGMLVFENGRIYGSDGGARYDGSYIYQEDTHRAEMTLKVIFPPNCNTVFGISNPYEWSTDVTANFDPKQQSAPLQVKSSFGQVLEAQITYLRSLPEAA
jgi:hypothetical protein